MVVPMPPCRRRGGLWWRREVGSSGEWRWDLVEKKTGGREKRKDGGEEKRGREKRMEDSWVF